MRWDSVKYSENPGLWAAALLVLVPFVLFGVGLVSPILFIGGLIVLIYLIMLLAHIEVGFLTLIVIRSSLDLFRTFGDGGGINLAVIVSAGLILLGLFYVLFRKVNPFEFEDSLPFLFLLIASGISVAYSPDFAAGLADWVRMLSFFFVYILTRIIFITEKKIQIALGAVLASAIIPMGFAFYQALTGQGAINEDGHMRIIGTFVHPNAFASYLLILLILGATQIFEPNREKPNILVRFLMLGMFGIFVLTFSRGAWIVFIVSMIIMGILRYKKILAMLPLVLAGALVLVPGIKARIMTVLEPSTANYHSAWDWRVNMWNEIMPLFQKKPLLGHGLASVEAEFGVLAHNDYLRLLVEVGAVGLFAYLVLAFFLFKNTWRDFKLTRTNWGKSFQVGLIAVILGFLLRQFADNTLRNAVVMIYFWILVGLARNAAWLSRSAVPERVDNAFQGPPK